MKPSSCLPGGSAIDPGPACHGGVDRSRLLFALNRSDRLELWNILSKRNCDLQPVRCAVAGIVGSQALAQAVCLDPHDRVGVLIEGRSAMEDFNADRVLLDLVGLPGEELFA